MSKIQIANQLKNIINHLENLNLKAAKTDSRFSMWRLLIFLSGVSVSLMLFFFSSDNYVIISIVIFTLGFAITVHFHSRFTSKVIRLRKWTTIKKANYARMNLDWENIPGYKLSEETPNALERDLNILGGKSLLKLVSTCTTEEGTDFLRNLLSNTSPNYEEVMRRQHLVEEISKLHKFRDKLLLSSMNVSGSFPRKFTEWLKLKKSVTMLRNIVIFLSLFGIVNVVLIFGSVFNLMPQYWTVSVLTYYAISFLLARKISGSTEDADELIKQLGNYSSVFEFIENYKYKNGSVLKNFTSDVTELKNKPSHLLGKTKSYMEILNMRANPFLWMMMVVVFPLDFYMGYKIEECKQKISEKFENWLRVWYELEAFSSLANFGALNPEYSFPKINSENSFHEPILRAESIGHPLIPEKEKVRNDFDINKVHEVFIFTGSNMSGKSTFLRAIGINTLLAYAGAPVDSKSFFVHLISLFSCINVSDSVVDGISYFYAEVKRLKELMNELDRDRKLPVVFLIDEIFKGTNNIERLKGSKAFIKMLIEKNATGIIATHDLELTRLAEANTGVKNYHFREDIINGKMHFNYKLFTGPCPTTNALKIMEMEGLPV